MSMLRQPTAGGYAMIPRMTYTRALVPEDLRRPHIDPAAADIPMYCRSLLGARGNPIEAARIARRLNASSRVIGLLEKGGIGALTSNDGAALQSFGGMSVSFLNALQTRSVLFYLLNNGARRVPPRTKISLTTAISVGTVPGEGRPAVVSKLSFDGAGLSVPTYAVAYSVLNNELNDSLTTEATATVNTAIADGVAKAVDASALTTLTTDAHTDSYSGGATGADALASLRMMAQSVPIGSASRLVFIAGSAVPAMAACLESGGVPVFPQATLTGGTLLGVPVLVSDGLDSDTLCLIDASGIVGAIDDPPMEVSVSRQAPIEMSDAPGSNALTGQGAQMVSMFQTNSVCLRALARFQVERVRPDCVSVLTDVAWGPTTTS